jgi:hypothetical protein
MKDIRIDSNGDQRCWKCGGRHFTHKRTARSKVLGVTTGLATFGAAGLVTTLATHKKLQCQSCGEYNDTGSAMPYSDAASATKQVSYEEKMAEIRERERQALAEQAALAHRGGP